MAAKTSAISYRREMTAQELEQALFKGLAPVELTSHLLHFRDEASLPVVVMAVEKTLQEEGVSPVQIWTDVSKMGKELGASPSCTTVGMSQPAVLPQGTWQSLLQIALILVESVVDREEM